MPRVGDPLPGEDLSHAKIYHMETGHETELNQRGSFKDEKILSSVQMFFIFHRICKV